MRIFIEPVFCRYEMEGVPTLPLVDDPDRKSIFLAVDLYGLCRLNASLLADGLS
ncbi:predicted ATPase [Zymobacter palmae]|uniref:Predicted ATPase n=1 Tax=Zymobacter palmae TaxID=33074 RepID=A0A348HG15_9GAMM|nr:predicted ATPase [Zymobacter palmae]